MFSNYPKFRQVCYIVMAVIGLILTSMQAYMLATGMDIPLWFVGTWAVFGVLTSALGTTAATNITPATAKRHDGDGDGSVVETEQE
jgi:galactitol-specific phosphotransferase system IIC component